MLVQAKRKKSEKLKYRCSFFVSTRARSKEVMVSTPVGIMTAKAIRRIPVEKRWGEDCVEWVEWAP